MLGIESSLWWPVIATSIPFISPILGMMRKNSRYYNYLRDKYSMPIFTLRLPFTRLYIITSTSLISAVQRQFRTLSFAPVQLRAVTNFASPSKKALDLFSRNIDNDDGFVPGFLKAFVMLAEMDKLAGKGSSTTVQMYKWTDEQITYATTDAIYGPHNPLRDPENLAAWHVYEAKTMTLVMGILPSLFAADAIKAREFLWKKYARYFAEGRHNEGSDYIQRRYAYMRSRGLSEDDTAKIELTGVFPLIGNSIPTAFWLVYRIFSSPAVLDDCQREVMQAVTEHGDDGVCTLDNACPVLASTYQEVFRFHGAGTSLRVATADSTISINTDHLLDGKYLLRKGGTVLIPGRVQHSSRAVWGEDADAFKHTRFVKAPGEKRHHPVAFRGFGGGTTLCPGRHFATTEILLFASLLVLRFDVRLAGGGGPAWPVPPTDKSSQAAAMDQPGCDIEIELVPRPRQNWRVVFSNAAGNGTKLGAEDLRAPSPLSAGSRGGDAAAAQAKLARVAPGSSTVRAPPSCVKALHPAHSAVSVQCVAFADEPFSAVIAAPS
ncbi:cytochrome P450 [Xylariomycetidae sp. FL0641]|nr:cytochrome P450 [Xylariomycetidae sp. FL0641]